MENEKYMKELPPQLGRVFVSEISVILTEMKKDPSKRYLDSSELPHTHSTEERRYLITALSILVQYSLYNTNYY